MATGAMSKINAPAQNGSNPRRSGVAPRSALLGIDELAHWLGVETGFVRRLIAQRKIPFLKIGKYIRFDPEEIAAWMDGQRVGVETTSHRR
jgi:excisionase family DNA binding protein